MPLLRANFDRWTTAILALVALSIFPSMGLADAPSAVAFCLNAAQEIEAANYLEKKSLITKQDKLSERLPPGCLTLTFEIRLRSKGRYHVIATDTGGARWSVNENKRLAKFDGADDEPRSEESTQKPSEPPADIPPSVALSLPVMPVKARAPATLPAPPPPPPQVHPLSTQLGKGFTELVNICQGAEERQLEAARRLASAEKERTKTLDENALLKSELDRQEQDLASIKAKMPTP